MNNTWWQEFVRFFLQGITLNRLMYMLIIFVLLILITPSSIKDWINSSSPDIFLSYWLYFCLFLVSYVTSQLIMLLIAGVKRRFRSRIKRSTRQAILNTLTNDEISLIKYMIDSGEIVELPTENRIVNKLRQKGIIERYYPPTESLLIFFVGDNEKELFKIADAYKSDFLY
ncbi:MULTISPECIES: super-infection exclusion protein B [unclassified Arsenophonus]|uniref:super-infection exclusion protein B n=1 Tax=unclassified Arsenophonus TaxID=2627083 RepID=UPI00285B6A42|nr:super-infection exclusion protein B [Arsenophonus sp.]MDR5615398.1 super-infection exclusion protein B [Arsenophonus sp.]